MYNTWEELKSACENCHRCELCETRTNVVVGVGNENAEVMFIERLEVPSQMAKPKASAMTNPRIILWVNFKITQQGDIGVDGIRFSATSTIYSCSPPSSRGCTADALAGAGSCLAISSCRGGAAACLPSYLEIINRNCWGTAAATASKLN